MTPSELKAAVEMCGHEPHFFTRSTMKFFGDTMRNYGVRRTVIMSNFDTNGQYRENGIEREVWELYRKRPVKHGLWASAYFDVKTYKRVFEMKVYDTA